MNENSSTAPRRSHAVRGMRILLVDDNRMYAEATKFVMEYHGGVITVAHNGEEAIALLHRQPFDVVLMDLSMPVMSGIEAVSRIRADPEIAHVRVIGTTGHLDPRAAEQCLAAGMDDVITKPFEIEALYARLASPCPQ
jgi:CheY-like chemotaxis protein